MASPPHNTLRMPDPSALPAVLEDHLAHLQGELDAMRAEVDLLRQRDEALNHSMRRIDEELRLAARLQQDFLPRTLPRVGGVRFHTLFRPAGYVSGDLYDVWRLDEHHVGFYLSDAVGHGMPAALLTMFIKNALQAKVVADGGYRLLDPCDVLAGLNRSMLEQRLSPTTFATAIYGLIDTRTLDVQLARAGHPLPLLLQSDGTISEVTSAGLVLGVLRDVVFPSCSVRLCPGQRLVLYTDGIEEAFAVVRGRPSIDQWKQELAARAQMDTDALLADLAATLDRRGNGAAAADDLTMVVLEAVPVVAA